MDELGTFVGDALERRGILAIEFAKLIGANKSTLNMWLHHKRKPPWKQWVKWADALGLEGDMRERLRWLMLLPHCPEPVQEWFAAGGLPPRRR